LGATTVHFTRITAELKDKAPVFGAVEQLAAAGAPGLDPGAGEDAAAELIRRGLKELAQ
jgi:hypothetical protein